MISYSGLMSKLAKRRITKTALANKLGISSRTMAKVARGEKINILVLVKIAEFLNCDVHDLFREVSDDALVRRLQEEKSMRLSGSLYHELQIRMTYNSNHIEGSSLTEKQTRYIFETRTINAGDGVPVDDIIETVNHFRAIDYCIDNAGEHLHESFIRALHFILKQSTYDSTFSWFAVGDYKKRINTVGGKETTPPEDVPAEMQKLLSWYQSLKNVSFEDILEFHYKFECIHPFQDGNGRVGRLIAFKECLHNNIMPFIIEDSKKMFYYRGLAEWPQEKGFLLETCRDGQDTFKQLLDKFDIS